MPSIVTLTLNPALDRSTRVDRLEPGPKLRCRESALDPGGGGINVARAIHRLGGEAMAGWISAGTVGDTVASLLDDEGVSHVAQTGPGQTRENVVIFEEATGDAYRLVMPGAELAFEHAERCLGRLLREGGSDPAYLVLSGSLPPGLPDDCYARLAGEVSGDVRVVLDTSGDALRRGASAPVHLLKPNRRELSEITERELEDRDDCAEAAREWIDSHPVEVILVSLGAEGLLCVTAEEATHLPAPEVEVRSRVGAGDSTVAGVVLSLLDGRDLVEAARFGVAAGSAAVLQQGSQLCRREDAERLFEAMPRPTREAAPQPNS